RHGPAGHVRQGRAGRAGRRRHPDPAGHQPDGRRHRGLIGGASAMVDEDALLAIGDRVVAMARPGEQVEAVVVHDRETEVRVYEGEVESLSSAESQGVGIRVVADQRQGFAYAGTLDDDVLAETLDEARDNAAFGTPDE